jgi:hypothetical protein
MLAAGLPGHLPAAAKFAVCVAVGCAYILKPILGFINGTMPSPRSPVLDFAVAVALVTLPATYLMGVTLLYVHVTPPRAPGGALGRVAYLACTLAFALLVALVAFLLLVASAGSPPSNGWTPT